MAPIGNKIPKYEFILLILLLLSMGNIAMAPAVTGVANLAAYGLTIFLIVKYKQINKLLFVILKDPFLLLLTTFALASFLWSAAPSVSLTDIRPVLRSYILGAYIALRFNPKQQMYLYCWVLGVATLLSLVLPLTLPGYGISGDSQLWKGIFRHKSNLGQVMSFGIITFAIAASSDLKNRKWLLACLGLSLLLIVLSDSKTSLLLLIISACLYPLKNFFEQKYKEKIFLSVLVVFFLGTSLISILQNLDFIVVDTLGKDLTFSGRTPLWTLCLEKAFERPWLGYGHAAFWKSPESIYVFDRLDWGGEYQGIETAMHAHSGFVDFFLQYGAVGFLFLLGSLSRLLSKTINLIIETSEYHYFWAFLFLVFFVLVNINLTNTLVTGSFFWSTYVAIALSISLSESRLKTSAMQNGMVKNPYLKAASSSPVSHI